MCYTIGRVRHRVSRMDMANWQRHRTLGHLVRSEMTSDKWRRYPHSLVLSWKNSCNANTIDIIEILSFFLVFIRERVSCLTEVLVKIHISTKLWSFLNWGKFRGRVEKVSPGPTDWLNGYGIEYIIRLENACPYLSTTWTQEKWELCFVGHCRTQSNEKHESIHLTFIEHSFELIT